MDRIQAAWLCELALGEPRDETALRFVLASLNVLTQQENHGKLASIVAERLRHMLTGSMRWWCRDGSRLLLFPRGQTLKSSSEAKH
jgi:hypothetical protein